MVAVTAATEKADPTTVQTLIFSRDKFHTAEAAKKWATEHDFSAAKVDETEDSYRLRQREPGEFTDGSFRTIDLDSGVKAVIGKLKKDQMAQAQKDRDKREPTPAEAEWESQRAGFLPQAGAKGLPFVAHAKERDAGRTHILRFGTPDGGSWSLSLDAPVVGKKLDAAVTFRGQNGGTWLEKWLNFPGFLERDRGEWTFAADTDGRVDLTLAGATYRGIYRIERSTGGAWHFRGPDGGSYAVVKAAAEQRYTLGVAYPADQVDAHGDKISPEELEKTAWEYIQRSARVGLLHKDGTEGAGSVVESYIYRGLDWTVEDQTVRAGDWLLGVVWAESAWSEIKKGNFQGYSIQGWAR